LIQFDLAINLEAYTDYRITTSQLILLPVYKQTSQNPFTLCVHWFTSYFHQTNSFYYVIMTASVAKDEDLIRMYLSTQKNKYFETLYQRYANKVFRRCYSLTKCSAKAEDFTHDIFLRVHSNLNNFKERSTFSTWLYSISYNYCMDQIRQGNRLPTVTIDEELAQLIADESETDNREEQLQVLTLAIQTITAEEIKLIQLKYEQDLDIKEIAERYNLKDSAVKMRLKRTRDKIRDQYTYRLNL